ncbi:deoxyguanosinetriphosphate triphosphohydrolase-like protein [Clostridia bacterium]|nr:deoxyguanosinetriphosphate triphosphohydrolase-like protein [Clostridia bacterium]
MTVRERIEQRERGSLSRFALCSADSRGRARPEPFCSTRTCFQRDVDRIIHSKAFRRLAQKTQVFLRPEGDHYRTRLTHTLEVMRIARTVSRALGLNEDLTEAVAMGHDLGHTPFGHAGERVLNELLPGGFSHNEHGVRVLERLEKNGLGLNVCIETLEGVRRHTGDLPPDTLESGVVRVADRIAYINSDFDDAVRAHILDEADIPADIRQLLGNSPRQRIDALTRDLIENSYERTYVALSKPVAAAMDTFRDFMFERVYLNPVAKSEEGKAQDLIARLFAHFAQNPDELPPDNRDTVETEGIQRAAADFIAGMTDRYAITKYAEIAVPKGWSVLD